ncbi:phage tail assembly protein [Mixta calida]|uniref:phage tail assembly protein n=1 Tax=Mixta calida TaxID=665913 RepID=UPI0034D529CC
MNYPHDTAIITLYTPLKLDGGGSLDQITMREPLVRDRIAFAKDRGTDEEKEARMLAQLCNLSEQDIWQLTAADYQQLQEKFEVFMLPPVKRPKPKSSGGSESSAGA